MLRNKAKRNETDLQPWSLLVTKQGVTWWNNEIDTILSLSILLFLFINPFLIKIYRKNSETGWNRPKNLKYAHYETEWNEMKRWNIHLFFYMFKFIILKGPFCLSICLSILQSGCPWFCNPYYNQVYFEVFWLLMTLQPLIKIFSYLVWDTWEGSLPFYIYEPLGHICLYKKSLNKEGWASDMFITSTFSVIRSRSLWSYFHASVILRYIFTIYLYRFICYETEMGL